MFPIYEDDLVGLKKYLSENPDKNSQQEFNKLVGELAGRNFFECLKWVVEEKGGDAKGKREDNGGPIATKAAGLGFAKCFKLLIDHGADFDEIDKFYEKRGGLLGVAFESGKVDMLKYVVEKQGLPKTDDKSFQKLILEAATDLQILSFLEEKGISCVFTPESAESDQPLHAACHRCRPDAIKYWLDHGADPNALNSEGNSPLHVLMKKHCFENEKSLVALFQAKDLNINIKNREGLTPIEAASKDDPEVIEALLRKGADATKLKEQFDTLSDNVKKIVKDWAYPEGKKRNLNQIIKDEKIATKKAKKDPDAPELKFHTLGADESRTGEWTGVGGGDDDDEANFTPISDINIHHDLISLSHPSVEVARQLATELGETMMQSEADVTFIPFVVPYSPSQAGLTPVAILSDALDSKNFTSRSAGKGQDYFSSIKLPGASVTGSATNAKNATKFMKESLQQAYKIKSPEADPGVSLIFVCGKDKNNNALVGVYTFAVCT